jgi:hypothetical protein
LVELVFDRDYCEELPSGLFADSPAPAIVLFLGEVKSSLSLVSLNDKCLLSDDLLSKKTPMPLVANTCIEYPVALNTKIAKTRILNMKYIVHQPLNSSIFLAAGCGIDRGLFYHSLSKYLDIFLLLDAKFIKFRKGIYYYKKLYLD